MYLNSFFNQRFSALPLLLQRLGLIPARPTVLAPRGEFSAGALAIRPRRKRAFRSLARAAGLYGKHLTWQASSDLEAEDIRRFVHPAAPVMVAPDLVDGGGAALGAQLPKQVGQLDLVFLSRLTRKKNLSGALDLLAGVRAQITLDVYGPEEDAEYAAECRARAERLPANICVRFHGAVPYDAVPAIMARHHIFFLPTFGENFGHVILEAMAAGTPVLISDLTPWRGLEGEKVGWDLPLDRPDLFQGAIERCAAMDEHAFAEWRAQAHSYAARRQSDGTALEQNRRLFQLSAGGA